MNNVKPRRLSPYWWPLNFIFFLILFPSHSFSLPPTERMSLQNGLRLIVSEAHSLPFVTFQLIIDGGSRFDPPNKEGLSYLTAKGLLHGTIKHTSKQMNELLDFMGANLHTDSSKDYITVGFKVLKKDLFQGFHLFMDVITLPVFPKDEFHSEIQRTLGIIKSVEEDPKELSEREFFKTLFAGTPYGHPVIGTEESILKLTRNDLAAFHSSYVRPNRAILVITGDISLNEIKMDLMSRLEAWPAGNVLPTSHKQPSAQNTKILTLERAISQANITLGNLAPQRNNPDFFPMIVTNYILGGGGFSSRLLTEIRAKRGLAYSIRSTFHFKKRVGSFLVSLQTKNDSAQEAISIVLEEIKKLQKEPVTDIELEGARKYLTGSFPLQLDTQAKLAGFLAQVEFYGLGEDYAHNYVSCIMAVTKEDVQRVAKKYLNPYNYTLVIVGNLKEGRFRK